MEYRACISSFGDLIYQLLSFFLEQKEQREELAGLLRKYGEAYEPWRNELAKYKNKGQDLMKR